MNNIAKIWALAALAGGLGCGLIGGGSKGGDGGILGLGGHSSSNASPGPSSGSGGSGGATSGGGFGGAPAADGSSGGNSCGKVQPCGGSVVGTWTVASICVLDSSALSQTLSGNCPTGKVDITALNESGTITYRNDQTYQRDGTVTFRLKVTLPNDCLPAPATCADLDATYRQKMLTDPTLTVASCTSSGPACLCDIGTTQAVNQPGTYTTSGTVLTTMPATGTTSTSSYCVQGKELHVIDLSMAMPMGSMGTANIAADVVLTRP